MNVVITNTVALNGGDAAILYAIRKELYDIFGESLNITVFDTNPDIASIKYPDIDFHELLYNRITWAGRIDKINNRYIRYIVRKASQYLNISRVWLGLYVAKNNGLSGARTFLTTSEYRSIMSYASADLVISTGGTYLVDYYTLEPRIFEFQLVHFLGKPLALYTQTVGSFSTPRYRRLLRILLNKARVILLRDNESIDNLVDIGVTRPPLVLTADAVFALASPKRLNEARDRNYPQNSKPHIAISVRDWKHFQTSSAEKGMMNYREVLSKAVVHLIQQHSSKVTFISTCQGIPEYGYNDSDVAHNIFDSLPTHVRSEVTIDDSFHKPSDLQRKLECFDFVIATRMHMAILALTIGTPVLPIAYEPKTMQLFNKMNAESWSTNIETIDDSFLYKIDQFIDNIHNVREIMIDGTLVERQAAKIAGARLVHETASRDH